MQLAVRISLEHFNEPLASLSGTTVYYTEEDDCLESFIKNDLADLAFLVRMVSTFVECAVMTSCSTKNTICTVMVKK